MSIFHTVSSASEHGRYRVKRKFAFVPRRRMFAGNQKEWLDYIFWFEYYFEIKRNYKDKFWVTCYRVKNLFFELPEEITNNLI